MRSSTIVFGLLALLLFGSIPTYAETIVAGHISENPGGGTFLISTTDYTLAGSFRGDDVAVWSYYPYKIGDAAYIGFDFGGADASGIGSTIIDGTSHEFLLSSYLSLAGSVRLQPSGPPIVISGAGLFSGPFTLTGSMSGRFLDSTNPNPWAIDIQDEFTGTGIATLTVIPSTPIFGSPRFNVTGIYYEFTTPVAEPSEFLLLFIALGAVGLIAWRRDN
jgi:hypothetical protein